LTHTTWKRNLDIRGDAPCTGARAARRKLQTQAKSGNRQPSFIAGTLGPATDALVHKT
jgi:methionine synthase I (cobalamin-dependent)